MLRTVLIVILVAAPLLFVRQAKGADAFIPVDHIEALGRIHRIDLLWNDSVDPDQWLQPHRFEVERATAATGPFKKIHDGFVQLPMYSDFVRKPGQSHSNETYFYRVRSTIGDATTSDDPSRFSQWSKVVSATSTGYSQEQFLTEIQEAGFRYFYHHAHPVSGLALEGAPDRDKNLVAIGASGMGMFNLVTGLQRGFITREKAAQHALKVLSFLNEKAERHHGAFSHWMDGTSGKRIAFGQDDGVDLVETAFLIQGVLLVRQLFDNETSSEVRIRELANQIWRDVEWDFFVRTDEQGQKSMSWHWSPISGFEKSFPIRGFNECQVAYLLAMISPTHPIERDVYLQGWFHPSYSQKRQLLGIDLELGNELGGPAFFTHYSYLGWEPRRIFLSTAQLLRPLFGPC